MAKNNKSKIPHRLVIKEDLLHSNLLILKASENFKSLEEVIQFLYNFYKMYGGKGPMIEVSDVINDLNDIYNINHPNHTLQIINKYMEMQNE